MWGFVRSILLASGLALWPVQDKAEAQTTCAGNSEAGDGLNHGKQLNN